MAVLLQAVKVGRQFLHGETAIQALQAVDLDVQDGEFTAIMGASGSGKSTLLYVLSGLDKPTSGEVKFKDQRIDNFSEKEIALMRRSAFGFVFQSINLVNNLTVEENILVAGYLTKTPRKLIGERCRELLNLMEIPDLAGRLPSQLSGGQQQRVALVRALINQPAVLFADEPTGALNHASGQKVLDHFNHVNSKGQTIVMVTHDLKTAIRAHRILFTRDGRIEGEYRFPESLTDKATDNSKQLPEREQALFSWLSERGW